MPVYHENSQIREVGENGVYFCPGKSNCLTDVPKNIHLEFEWGDWENPALYVDKIGDAGGNLYAVRASSTYPGHDARKAFDRQNGGDDTWEAASRTLNDWLEFYAPFPVKLNYIHFTNRPSYVTGYSVVRLTASNDGVNYVELKQFPYTLGNSSQWDIQVNSNVGYKYFRLSAGDGATLIGDGDAKFAFGEVHLVGQAKNVLTLKAGSKIYWPDGRSIVLGQDLANDNLLTSGDLMFLCYTPTHPESNQKNINYILNSNHYTQTTPPATGSVFNPDTKRIDYYNNSVISVTDYSLPFCSVTNTNGVVQIVDVFDWFVPLKKSLFLLPEVKYLSANGTVENLYQNEENEITELLYNEGTWTTGENFELFVHSNNIWYNFNNYTQKDMPLNNAYSSWYNPATNKLLYNSSADNVKDISEWVERRNFLALGAFDLDSNKGISKVHLKEVQEANSLLPVHEIYCGNQLVYDFQVYTPGDILGEIANPGDGANNVFYVDMPKPGVLKYWGVGGGNGNTWCYIGCNYAGSAAGFIGKLYFNRKCRLRVIVGRNYEASQLAVAEWGTEDWTTLIQCNYGANAGGGGGGSGGSVYVNRDSTFNTFFDIELERNGNGGNNSTYGGSVWNGYGRAGTNGYGKLEYVRKEQ